MITIPAQDTASSNPFSAFTNNSNDICVTKICKNSKKLSLKQSNDNIPKQLITTLSVHSKKNMVTTSSKRQNNISSNSKNSKNKDVSAITGDSIIKDIKCCELSKKSEKFVVKFFGGATTKDMESMDHRTCSEKCHLTLWYKWLKNSYWSWTNCRKHHQPCKIQENR